MSDKPTSYDEALHELENLMQQLESPTPISMEDYKTKAIRAKELIAYCHQQLTQLDSELKPLL